jgi:ribosomal protein L39E
MWIRIRIRIRNTGVAYPWHFVTDPDPQLVPQTNASCYFTFKMGTKTKLKKGCRLNFWVPSWRSMTKTKIRIRIRIH